MIDAIAELTAEQGYDATKIADIVRRAGVARKTLYDNFDGKEDLFLSAFDLYFVETKRTVEEACDATGGAWPQRIESGVAALLRCVEERPAAARLCMIEALSATPAASARYDAALRELVDLLKRNAPENTDLPPTLEETLVGGVAWILNQQIRKGRASRAGELLSELSEFILSPYPGVDTKGVKAPRRK